MYDVRYHPIRVTKSCNKIRGGVAETSAGSDPGKPLKE